MGCLENLKKSEPYRFKKGQSGNPAGRPKNRVPEAMAKIIGKGRAKKFYSLTEHSMAPELLVFSKRVWDGLSADERKIIKQAAKESVPHMRKLWDEQEEKSRKLVEAAGVTIVSDVNKQSFADAVKPVYDKFASDPKLKSLISRIQQTN